MRWFGLPSSIRRQRPAIHTRRASQLDAAPAAWKDVLARMEAMQEANTLFPGDEPFLDEARRRAGRAVEAMEAE